MPILTKLKQGQSIGEEEIILILQLRERFISEIEENKLRYVKEIKYLDGEIQQLDKIRFQTTEAVAIKKKEEELRDGYKKSLALVCEMESLINHVWFHYQQLPYDLKMALEILYVSRKGWKFICDELHIGKKRAIEYRNKAIEEIVEKLNA